MDVEGNEHQLITNLVDDGLQNDWISSFNDFLAKVVSKLVDNDIRKQGKNLVSQALVKGISLECKLILAHVNNLLLQHPTSDLVEAVVVQIAQHLLVFF